MEHWTDCYSRLEKKLDAGHVFESPAEIMRGFSYVRNLTNAKWFGWSVGAVRFGLEVPCKTGVMYIWLTQQGEYFTRFVRKDETKLLEAIEKVRILPKKGKAYSEYALEILKAIESDN